MAIGERIRFFRNLKGMTQKYLGTEQISPPCIPFYLSSLQPEHYHFNFFASIGENCTGQKVSLSR